MHNLITKYVAPTRLDCEPVGTVWEHITDGPLGPLYIQICDNPETPEWLSLGDLLASTFRDKALDKTFIKTQIKNYKSDK
jgi:hypothetical protein